jgi:hypothetical protein
LNPPSGIPAAGEGRAGTFQGTPQCALVVAPSGEQGNNNSEVVRGNDNSNTEEPPEFEKAASAAHRISATFLCFALGGLIFFFNQNQPKSMKIHEKLPKSMKINQNQRTTSPSRWMKKGYKINAANLKNFSNLHTVNPNNSNLGFEKLPWP